MCHHLNYHNGLRIVEIGSADALNLCYEMILLQESDSNNKSTIVDSRRPNHDEVQSVTAVKWFRRKRVAVYPLHAFELWVSEHQTIIQSEMTLVSGGVFQLQCRQKGIYLSK